MQRHLLRGDRAAVLVEQERGVVVGGSPPSARRSRMRVSSGDGGTCPSRSARELVGPGTGVDQRPGDEVLPGQRRLAVEVLRSSSSSAWASPEKAAAKPACAATPSLISSATKWPSSTMSARVTPSTAETAS